MAEYVINIAKDFYPRPSGRYLKHGNYTGEAFREKVLAPILEEAFKFSDKPHLLIDFTGVTMSGSSFLDEAFGGLVRKYGYDKDVLHSVLEIHSPRRPGIPAKIKEYINEAEKE